MDSFDSSLSSSSSGRAEVYRPEEQIVGFTSAFLSRGRSAGYGLYFSKTRIIGVRKRRVTIAFGIACAVPLTALLFYLQFVLRLSGTFYATSIFLFLPLIFDQLMRRFGRTVPERLMRKNNPATTSELGSKIDFELRREEISELSMKHAIWGRLSSQPGYLRITPKSGLEKPIEIKIHGIKQVQILRDIVIEFAARRPQVRALED